MPLVTPAAATVASVAAIRLAFLRGVRFACQTIGGRSTSAGLVMGLNERAAVRMSTGEQRQFLESGRKLVLASHARDGSIQLVVMHYGFLDNGLAFLTKRTSQKVSNFSRDPRASIIVHAGERYNELQGLCLAGRIQVIDEVDRVMEVARTMKLRYDEVKDPAKLERAMRNRVVLKFATERAISWDHTKIGSPPWSDEATAGRDEG